MGPVIAPFIGGYLQVYFGWHAPFYFLTGYGIVILVMALSVLPETNLSPSPIDAKTLVSQCKTTLTNPIYLSGTLICGLLFGYYSIYVVMAPFLIQNVLGKSAIYYGNIALILGLGAFMGQIINRMLLSISMSIKIKIPLVIILLFSFYMLVWALTQSLGIVAMTLPVFFIYIGTVASQSET